MINMLAWICLLNSITNLPIGAGSYDSVFAKNHYSGGYTTCYDKPVVYLEPGVVFNVVLHEYLHAVDCLDNGKFDGSPYPGDLTGIKDPAHYWVYWAMNNLEEADLVVRRISNG